MEGGLRDELVISREVKRCLLSHFRAHKFKIPSKQICYFTLHARKCVPYKSRQSVQVDCPLDGNILGALVKIGRTSC